MTNGKYSTSSLRSNQVLINCAQIVIDRRDRLDLNLAHGHHLVEQEIKAIRISRLHEQAMTIVVQARFHHFVLWNMRAASNDGWSQRIRICIGCSTSISSRTPWTAPSSTT